MPINEEVLQFAARNMRRRVGRRGECFDLADAALREAGARRPADFGSVGRDDDYVWGSQVEWSTVVPGDIIQFRNYRFHLSNSDGSSREETRPHHTAIVESIDRTAGTIVVLEQNVYRRRVVQRNTLYFQSGTQTGGPTVTISGSFWFYHPQARVMPH